MPLLIISYAFAGYAIDCHYAPPMSPDAITYATAPCHVAADAIPALIRFHAAMLMLLMLLPSALKASLI